MRRRYRAEHRRPGARRRARLHRPRAKCGPADARRQRDLGRLPGRWLQDDHPGPRARQAPAAARRRPGAGHDLRAAPRPTSPRSRRPASRSTVRYLGGGRPSLTPIDHPATQAAARALEATFGVERRCTSARAARSRWPRLRSLLGLPVVLLGFTPAQRRARAQRVDGPGQLRARRSGRSSASGTSWRDLIDARDGAGTDRRLRCGS